MDNLIFDFIFNSMILNEMSIRVRMFVRLMHLVIALLPLCVRGQGPRQPENTGSSRQQLVPGAPSARRPNIIFLLTDDQRWDALGAMGNRLIRTPNLDRLAGRGILFRNAYVTTSICCCSRASLLTGQYTSRHTINDFSTNMTPAAVAATYPILLKQQGYTIGFIDKYGVGDKPPASLYDYWTCTDKSQPDYLLPDGKGHTLHNTDSAANSIREFLDRFGSRGPFCLSVSFKAPHEQDAQGATPSQLIVQDQYKDLYRDSTIPEPLTADPKYWNRLPDFMRTDKNIGRVRWKTYFSTPALYQQTVKNYYRLITGVDGVVGQLEEELKKAGLADNTIILFMGDNGMFLGEHGLQGKWFGYEESIRVPLIVYDPRLPAALQGLRSDQVALNIDIAPTILKMAGVTIPAGMQGISLEDLVQHRVPDRPDFYYEHHFLHTPELPQTEGVAGGRFKYLFYPEHDYEELFDIRKDPHETTNLAGDPAYKALLVKMRKRYEALKKQAM
ncbi:MAG: sulfatase [Puia sp.]|nr:sulfatase [Puia sp.]